MIALPEEQDKLLKQLNDIDSLERQGIFPERSNINIFLLGLNWMLGILWSITNIINGEKQFVPIIFGFCILFSIALTLAFYNKKIGFYLSCLFILIVNAYETYLIPGHNSQLIIFLDGVTVFTFANQFRKNGFIFASIAMVLKVIILFIIFGKIADLENLLAAVLSIVTLGIIPLLIASISRVGRRAKKGEIRAEILAMQNQDLMRSWQDYYKSVESERSRMKNPAPLPEVPVQVQNSTPENTPPPVIQEGEYTSPYAKKEKS